MNVLKNRKALYAGPTVFRFICTMSNVNELRSSLYPLSLPSLSSVPVMKPPLSFCLLYFFHSFFFPGFVLRCSPPSPLPRPDQSMQDFCVDWLASEGPRLPSMGTKTCREHREQEATNCCKLKNTNAHLSEVLSAEFFVSLAPSFAIFWFSASTPSSALRGNTCVLASPYRHVILSILSLEHNAIRVCILSAAVRIRTLIL